MLLRRGVLCFSRSSVKFQGHKATKWSILTFIGRFRTLTPVWIHQLLRMMHKAWSSIEDVLYCFSRPSVKFQGHTGQTIVDFDPNWAFPDCNPSLNSLMAMKWWTNLTQHSRCARLFFKVIRQIQGHTGQIIADFDPNWVFPDCNSILNSP